MKRKLFMFIFIFSALVNVSCKKNGKWKLPTELDTKVNIENTISSSNNIVFTNGFITMSEFQFDGKRDQGDDMFFTKPLGKLSIPFSNNPINELNFDIPQGTYSRIIISFKTFLGTSHDNDSSDSDKSSKHSIAIEGIYTNSDGHDYPLRFELNSEEHYTIVAQNKTGNNQIIFDKDIPLTAYITFNPTYWFQTISSTMLDNIIETNEEDNGESNKDSDSILINKDTNSSLYDIIINRIGNEATIIIN